MEERTADGEEIVMRGQKSSDLIEPCSRLLNCAAVFVAQQFPAVVTPSFHIVVPKRENGFGVLLIPIRPHRIEGSG